MLTATLNRTRRLGCEYECSVPVTGTGSGNDVQTTLARILTANGIRAIARGYDHSLLPGNVDIAVEYDSSVRGESEYAGISWHPVEIKTRILEGLDDWERIVPRTLEIVRYMGARVNTTCGHHIHLAFDEIKGDPRTARSLWNLFHRFDPVIFGLVAPSRRDNQYCRAMSPSAGSFLHGANSLRSLRTKLSRLNRYDALNLTHLFDEHPHLELRHHSGTLSPATARMWLRFCLQMIQHAVNRSCQAAQSPLPNDRKGIEKLLVTAGFKVNTKVYAKVDPELRETGKWLLKRWKHFNGRHPLKNMKKAKAQPQDEEALVCAE